MRPSEIPDNSSVANTDVVPTSAPRGSGIGNSGGGGGGRAVAEQGLPDVFSRRPLQRADYVSFLLLFLALVAIAQIVKPEPSQASTDPVAALDTLHIPTPPPLLDAPGTLAGRGSGTPSPAVLDEVDPAVTASTLGTLVSPDHRLWIVATPAGPRFTVTDAHGRVLASHLTDSELRSRFPQLMIDDKEAGSLMMVTEP